MVIVKLHVKHPLLFLSQTGYYLGQTLGKLSVTARLINLLIKNEQIDQNHSTQGLFIRHDFILPTQPDSRAPD